MRRAFSRGLSWIPLMKRVPMTQRSAQRVLDAAAHEGGKRRWHSAGGATARRSEQRPQIRPGRTAKWLYQSTREVTWILESGLETGRDAAGRAAKEERWRSTLARE